MPRSRIDGNVWRIDTHKRLPLRVFVTFCLLTQSVGAVEYPDCTNECLEYDSKQSNGEASEMLEFGEMQSTPSLQTLQRPLWPRVVAPDGVLSMGQM